MERELLRKVQLTQLEIAKEIRRVCEENDIPYFLTPGTTIWTWECCGRIMRSSAASPRKS